MFRRCRVNSKTAQTCRLVFLSLLVLFLLLVGWAFLFSFPETKVSLLLAAVTFVCVCGSITRFFFGKT